MSSPPSDSSAAAALAQVADELAGLRRSVDSMARRLGDLTTENATLRARLEQSEAARADLVAQTGHIVELLGETRRELRTQWQSQEPRS